MAKTKALQRKAIHKALIVAIDDYPGTKNDLRGCIEDSKAITALLQSASYDFKEIATYTNEQATLANVNAGLNWLFSDPTSLTANDRLVFYFSGHGWRKMEDGSNRECLCLHDGFLFDTELVQLTQDMPSGILNVILDCCHAGGLEKKFQEVLMTNAKSGESPEIPRIKTWLPDDEEFVKAFAAEQAGLPVKPFGCPPLFQAQGWKSFDEQKSAELRVNGLVLAACQPEQIASASTPQTQGKSAFTYSVFEALRHVGTSAVLSNSQLLDRVSAILDSLKFKQIPMLYEPANAPDLEDKSFITLQPIPAATTPAKSFDPSTSLDSTITQPKGEQTMSTVQAPALNLNRPLTEADAKFCSAVMQSCLQIAPMMYKTLNEKDFQTNGQEPIADGKFWGLIVGALIPAIPGIIDLVSGKDFQTDSNEPIAEDKFWTQVISAVIGVIPGIIGAVNKDFQAHSGVRMPSVVKAPIPVPSPVPVPVASAPVPALNGSAPDSVDEKFWRALLAGMIPAIAG